MYILKVNSMNFNKFEEIKNYIIKILFFLYYLIIHLLLLFQLTHIFSFYLQIYVQIINIINQFRINKIFQIISLLFWIFFNYYFSQIYWTLNFLNNLFLFFYIFNFYIFSSETIYQILIILKFFISFLTYIFY